MKTVTIKGQEYTSCECDGCHNNEYNSVITVIDGYGFYCTEHVEDLFINCPHCEDMTEIPLKNQPCICYWCRGDIKDCFI